MALFDDENISDPEATIKKKPHLLIINLDDESCTISTSKDFLSASEQVLRTAAWNKYRYTNKEGGDQDFTTLMQKLELTVAKIKQAIIEMEA